LNTLSKILQTHSQNNDNNGITFIKPKESFLSYKELSLNALKLLTHFNSMGLKKDSKLIFQLNDNENFVHSFWASISGGIVAVPVSTGNNDEHRLKLFNIYDVLDDAYLIVDSDILDKLEGYSS
jgi:non-ribosomal peptide synthetase component E (peptide arylation enzyme)